ncbi:hypothetical protein BDV37DRAFT_264783 [Aspergillus pseudonomiae]|uniref:Uncharacterized protein n=1 Tax=Aspergillus pseudonomiae TaxID=1506151 RepID=A0A5N7CUC5_9EURO|nr:uncharacterized protein BDV37DRAFT_264783 [Aspergillus pseudonomiae]KAE8397806.1 hypothetical protein BDV37DRAFT_264783 [Aspergillus pseudonomiae]
MPSSRTPLGFTKSGLLCIGISVSPDTILLWSFSWDVSLTHTHASFYFSFLGWSLFLFFLCC